MRPFIDDLDELDFVGSARARRLYEKQRHKEARFGSTMADGPRKKPRNDDYDDYEDYDDYDDDEDYEDYEDYDDEFDSYTQVHQPY